jgi:hypothetical protein
MVAFSAKGASNAHKRPWPVPARLQGSKRRLVALASRIEKVRLRPRCPPRSSPLRTTMKDPTPLILFVIRACLHGLRCGPAANSSMMRRFRSTFASLPSVNGSEEDRKKDGVQQERNYQMTQPRPPTLRSNASIAKSSSGSDNLKSSSGASRRVHWRP